jgi:frataxin-like iron-binding protein CyaY
MGQADDDCHEIVGGLDTAENQNMCENEGKRLDYQSSKLGAIVISKKDRPFHQILHMISILSGRLWTYLFGQTLHRRKDECGTFCCCDFS